MFHPEDQPCPAGWVSHDQATLNPYAEANDPVRFAQGRIPTLFIEGWYNVAQIPWTTEGKLTLSNGDQTGYSIHVSDENISFLLACTRTDCGLAPGEQGDFINGFSEGTPENPSILRQAMTTCDAMNGGEREMHALLPSTILTLLKPTQTLDSVPCCKSKRLGNVPLLERSMR
jgi:hypothetical protein